MRSRSFGHFVTSGALQTVRGSSSSSRSRVDMDYLSPNKKSWSTSSLMQRGQIRESRTPPSCSTPCPYPSIDAGPRSPFLFGRGKPFRSVSKSVLGMVFCSSLPVFLLRLRPPLDFHSAAAQPRESSTSSHGMRASGESASAAHREFLTRSPPEPFARNHVPAWLTTPPSVRLFLAAN